MVQEHQQILVGLQPVAPLTRKGLVVVAVVAALAPGDYVVYRSSVADLAVHAWRKYRSYSRAYDRLGDVRATVDVQRDHTAALPVVADSMTYRQGH